MKRLILISILLVLFSTLVTGGTYVPPAKDNIKLTLTSGYTAPSQGNIKLYLERSDAAEVIANITLQSPENNSEHNSTDTINFFYLTNFSDDVLDNCSLQSNRTGVFATESTETSVVNESNQSLSAMFPAGRFEWRVQCESSTAQYNSTTIRIFNVSDIVTGDFNLTNCLSSYIINSSASNSTGQFPTGQNLTNCSFNVTNNGTFNSTFQLRYNGPLDYNEVTSIESFSLLGVPERRWETDRNQTYVNDTFNSTRLCYEFTEFGLNKTNGGESVRVRYEFNNSYSAEREIYNSTTGAPLILDNTTNATSANATFLCPENFTFKFNFTERTNYSRFDSMSVDYLLESDNTASFRVNVTDNNSVSVVSPYTQTNNSATFQTLIVSLAGLNLENLSTYQFQFNGTERGKMVLDNFRFNETDGERKIDFFVGNTTFANAINLTSSYQDIYNLTINETKPLLFWFNFYDPLRGIKVSLGNLELRGVAIP